MGRGGEGDRGDEAGKKRNRDRHHQFHAHENCGLQDAEDRGFHRGAAEEPVREDLAAEPARSVLGGEGPAGELAPLSSRRKPGRHWREAYDRFASFRNACTASNSIMRFFSMTMLWVPSGSAT